MKVYDVYFTANLLHSVIKEGMVTVQAKNPDDARVRAALKIYSTLQTLFKSGKNYDYAIWSVEPHGETVDAEILSA